MAANKYDHSGLGDYVTKIYEQFAKERARVIETKWNTNRADFLSEFRQLWKHGEGEEWRSKVTAGIVSQKVRALYSIILDVYLQGWRIPFKFQPHESLNPDQTDTADLDLATNRVSQAFERCHAERAFMDNAFMACMLGKTYAKVTRQKFNRTAVVPVMPLQQAAMFGIDPATVPRVPRVATEDGDAWEYVSNWEMFTDPEAAFNCRNGSLVFQAQLISPYTLRCKIGQAYFIDTMIEETIETAPKTEQKQSGTSDQSLPPYLRSLADRKRNIHYIEAWGRVPNEQINKFLRETAAQQFGLDADGFNARLNPKDGVGEDGRESEVHLCLANGNIVRFALVDRDDNPFYEVDLERIPDEPMGRGVADNAKMGHDLVSMGLRSFVDNKAWSANVQMAMKRRLFLKTPDAVKPGGMWYLSEDARTAQDAMQQIIVQDVGETLLSLIAIGEKYADWDTMMSKIEQGQLSQTKKTATEIVQQAKRSDSYTGGVIRNFDENLTEPIAERFYLNMVQNPDLNGGKGDFVCQALGFESYQENVSTITALMSMYDAFRQDPEARGEMNVRKLMETLSKRNRIDPKTFLLSPEEKAQRAALIAAQQPAPEAPDPLATAEREAQIRKTEAEASAKEADVAMRAREIQPGTHPGLRGVIVKPQK